MITMMFGFDPASSESDSAEEAVAFAMMAAREVTAMNSDSVFKIEFSVLVLIEARVCRLPRAVLL